jgi:Flp pilus assembly protein TadD
VLTVDPQNKFAAYDLGVIAQQQGQADDARMWYGRALKIDPSYKPALNNLAILLTPTQPEAAIALYRTLLTLNANDASVHLRLGLVLRQIGKTDEATMEFNIAVFIDPKLANQVPPG